jgi:hydroxybutyrate-dimer hydrolase
LAGSPIPRLLHASHYQFATPAIAVTYANTYGRFRVTDNVCGFSFAAVDATGSPTAASAAAIAGSFSNGNGVPPTLGLQIIYNTSVGGAKNHFSGASASTSARWTCPTTAPSACVRCGPAAPPTPRA